MEGIKMELKQYNGYYATFQRQGNDKNGNPIYIINIFDNDFYNVNWKVDKRKDKYNNIKVTTYNIDDTIKNIIDNL